MFPLNLPNVLTLLRILAVPVIVVALLEETPNGDTLAAGVFALAAITDGLDGYIARRRQDVTTFGKLMDPLADKLLIIAALVSLVSLDRLAAWIAMVIIARELAVTVLRAVAAEQGVVISASWLGKVKTALQVAAIFALIIWNPSPLAGRRAGLPGGGRHGDLGRRLLLRAAQAARRSSAAAHASKRAARARPLVAAGRLEPLPLGHVMAGVLAGLELGEDLAEQAGALRDDGVAMDRLQVLLAGEHEAALARGRGRPRRLARTISRTQSSTKRGLRWAFSTTATLVRALHQLVDLGAHRLLDDVQQVAGVDVQRRRPRGGRCEASRCRAGCGSRPGTASKTRSISSSVKPSATRRSRERSGDQLLGAGAGGHPLGLDAGERAGSALGRDGGAEQRVDLLGRDAGDGRRDRLG